MVFFVRQGQYRVCRVKTLQSQRLYALAGEVWAGDKGGV
jgi:hypothetical protein